jgi:hypothetical protein
MSYYSVMVIPNQKLKIKQAQYLRSISDVLRAHIDHGYTATSILEIINKGDVELSLHTLNKQLAKLRKETSTSYKKSQRATLPRVDTAEPLSGEPSHPSKVQHVSTPRKYPQSVSYSTPAPVSGLAPSRVEQALRKVGQEDK